MRVGVGSNTAPLYIKFGITGDVVAHVASVLTPIDLLSSSILISRLHLHYSMNQLTVSSQKTVSR